MKKRILSTLLALCLVMALIPAFALAVDLTGDGTSQNPYQVGTEEELRSAVEAGGYIDITADIENISSSIVIRDADANITIDLNGNTLAFTASGTCFNVVNGNLTVTDSGEGGLITSTTSRVVQIYNTATFTLSGGTIELTDLDYDADVTIFNFGTLNISGGTVRGVTAVYNYAPVALGFTGNAVCNLTGGTIEGAACTTHNDEPDETKKGIGSNWACVLIGEGIDEDGNVKNYDGITLNIDGGSIITAPGGGQAIATNASSGAYAGFTINMSAGSVISEDGCGMYLPAIGKTNISGGTVRGEQAIRIAAGELDITGGEIIGTAAMTEDTDLVNGGSGGTQGAIVVGKAGKSGYVGDVTVNIGEGASVSNVAESGTTAAVVVSDKYMGETAYTDNSISVNINNTTVDGDVVKVSNVTQADEPTQDGGNTSLTINNATVNGDVINQSKQGSAEITGTTVNGEVKAENESSVLISDNSTTGAVTASGTSAITIIDSTVASTANDTGSTIAIVDTVVGDSDEPTTDVGNNVAQVGGKPYETLSEALAAAGSGQTVTLLTTQEVKLESAIGAGVTVVVGKGQQLTVEATSAAAVLGSEGVLQLDAGSSLNLVGNAVAGTDGMLDITSGSAEIVFSDSSVVLTSGSQANVPAGKELNLLLPGGQVRLNATIESEATATVYGQLTVPNNASLSVDGALNIASSGLLRIGSQATLTGSGSIANAGIVTLHRNDANNYEPTLGINISLTPGGEVYSELKDTDVDSLIGNFSKVSGQFTVEGIDDVTFTDRYSYYSPAIVTTTYTVTVNTAANGTVTANPVISASGNTITLTVTPADGYELNTLAVTNTAGNSIALTDRGNGVYTFTMPASNVTVSAAFVQSGTATGLPFTDVAANAWYYDAVKYAYDNGIMNGTSTTTFSPDITTSRGMIVTMLYRLENEPSVTGTGDFTDVSAGSYYADAIAWAAANDIVNGFGDDTFRPDQAITREQMATILYRYAAYKSYDVTAGGMAIYEFTDYEDISEYAVNAFTWAVASNLIDGMGDNTLQPQGTATRAQVAQLLMKFCQAFVE